MPVPDHSTFETAYAGQAPWDIGRPQKLFIDVADRITGSILDTGCGTGENALFFARQGHKVTGIDIIEEAINGPRERRPSGACQPPSWSWTPWPSKTFPKCSTA